MNAINGGLVWEMPFTERVYNVSTVTLDYLSPVVVAGLQDQLSLPDHAWALASSTETGMVEEPLSRIIDLVNPCSGAVSFKVLGEGTVSVQCFNLAGRIEFTGEYSGDQSVSGISLCQGIYILLVSRGTLTEVIKVTVL